MTYKIFKQGVEELGLRCKFDPYGVGVYLADMDYSIAFIFCEKSYYGSIHFSPTLSSFESGVLLILCCELMQTPPNERGEIECYIENLKER